MEYVCKVGTLSGEVIEKTFSAPDEAALRQELLQQGYYIFTVRGGLSARELRLGPRRVRNSVLFIFGQELAALLKAGLPLLQSLEIMLERQKDPVFRQSLTNVRDKVKSGGSLSDAFRAEGEAYPPILAASLVAGERSGNLELVLRRFVSYLRLNEAIKKKALSAAVYPILLLTLMGGLGGIMVFLVIPSFRGFYEQFGADLPPLTNAVMGLATFARRWGLVLLFGLLAALVLGALWLRRPESQLRVDSALLKIPYLGPLMRMYATSQLARTLATLLAGGLPLLNALEVAAQSVGNRAVARAASSSVPQIREGKSLTQALESTRMFETLPLEMVKVGEQTGALGDMLNAVAEFYDEDLATRLATVVSLVEPLLLLVMAGLVALMLLAFYLPLFQVFTVIH